jgi:hypothetical protein
VLIDYDDYIAWQEELDDLRAARRAAAPPWSEFNAELIAEGLLDEAE